VKADYLGESLGEKPLAKISFGKKREDLMSVVSIPVTSAFRGLAGIGLVGLLACALATPASAQLVTHRDLSASLALAIAQTALDTCTQRGFRVSVTVVGRNGEVLVQVRGDNAPPHTMENSMRKAYTSRTFRIPSGEMVKRVKADPQLAAVYLTNVIATQGALPIMVGEDVIGAAGVSGAPGGEKDEACVQAALDKVADQLK
jgi:uncharacterized protein GlcG (DUF336 family)